MLMHWYVFPQCFAANGSCDKKQDCADSSDEISCDIDVYIHLNLFFKNYSLPPPAAIKFDGSGSFIAYPLSPSLAQGDCSPYSMTHFQCQRDHYCLPVYLRCNGVRDCGDGEDEAQCNSFLCPGYYRCRGSRVCLHASHLCDGWSQCSQRDDELFCNLTCPVSCTCHGLALFCTQPFSVERYPQLRYLEADGSGLSVVGVSNNTLLIHLSLSRCGLRHIHNVTLPNLHSLDLSNNLLTVFNHFNLGLFPALRTCSLAGNPLMSVFVDSTAQLFTNLRNMDLSGVNLTQLNTAKFIHMPALRTLNLSACRLHSVTGNGFEFLTELSVIDFRGNSMSEFPKNLLRVVGTLDSLYADNYKLCCPQTLPDGFNINNCLAPVDELSSCEALLRSNVYRVFLFTFSILSLLGNSASFIMRVFVEKQNTGFHVFVTHLSLSDLVMGVYLAMIGVADHLYLGTYLWNDKAWRHGGACKTAGFLSLLSSEVSAFLVAIITLDRLLVVSFPFSNVRFSPRSGQLTCGLTWVVGAILASLPLLPATAHWHFYSQTGICIPLPITRQTYPGHGYSFSLLIVLNFVLFLLIAVGQASIFFSVRRNTLTDVTNVTTRRSRDFQIARRLITIATTDFLCWFPIGMLGLLASQGTSVPGEVNVAMAILVLPVNSALNPFLYTLNVFLERRRRQREERLLKRLTLLVKQNAGLNQD